MTCNNNFCIYEENSTCLLNEISINEMGICEECIMIQIPDKFLNKGKLQQRQRYDEDLNQLEKSIEEYKNRKNS